jgi:hypothetical protein
MLQRSLVIWTVVSLTTAKFKPLIFSDYCSILLNISYNHFARTTQKTASIVKEVCLLIRCLAVDVLLRALATAGMCLPSRCLAMGLHVTVCNGTCVDSCELRMSLSSPCYSFVFWIWNSNFGWVRRVSGLWVARPRSTEAARRLVGTRHQALNHQASRSWRCFETSRCLRNTRHFNPEFQTLYVSPLTCSSPCLLVFLLTSLFDTED